MAVSAAGDSMVAPSYDGERCVGVCPNCRAKFDVPVPEFYGVERAKERTGHCPSCRNMVNFEYWRGPVMARE